MMPALVAVWLLAAFAPAEAAAQQGAPPPAVLVQPAELRPIAAQAEFIGRAAAVDKVGLRARV
jgi:membrane fusion protein (multidrug efflux system)